MSCLRKSGLNDTIQTNGVEITRRGWWYRMWCVHASEDRVDYVRIDHRTGPGWTATNYEGQVCRECGYVHWEKKIINWPRAQVGDDIGGGVPMGIINNDGVKRFFGKELGDLPMTINGKPMLRVSHYDELPGGMRGPDRDYLHEERRRQRLEEAQKRPRPHVRPAPPPSPKPGFMKTSEERIRERRRDDDDSGLGAFAAGLALGSLTGHAAEAPAPSSSSSEPFSSGGGGDYGGGGASSSWDSGSDSSSSSGGDSGGGGSSGSGD